ncbi:uroporphyrinogen-III synthase [Lysobacter sp. Root494]|uniref:uroporphyrinogen-III synthase n=1 Tax=Lysobacter sp. Root494 TaxID=1736549 RepID=UPI0006FE0B62|nr:uroporphyrinogen-III synthase [Lysobacter sp. Root494]KQY49341.1 uroporphyrinogen-III synthase [Lysobacter sp. Root494]
MSRRSTPSWYVISLRPRGEHAALRREAARRGGGLIALSPWRLQLRDDDATRAGLHDALAASHVVFTSPAAVRAARALQALHARPGQSVCAVGAGTAAALQRAGVANVHSPARMDSEGLLALPVLQDVRGCDVGLVTAPGGRGEIAPALGARGARVLRADVYVREPVPLSTRAVQQLREADAPLVLALSSGAALQCVLAALPADPVAKVKAVRVVAASERLRTLALGLGFVDVEVAAGPRPRDLVDAAARRLPVA